MHATKTILSEMYSITIDTRPPTSRASQSFILRFPNDQDADQVVRIAVETVEPRLGRLDAKYHQVSQSPPIC